MENYKCFVSDNTKELMKKDFKKKVKEVEEHLKELKESNLLTKRDFEMLVHTYTSVVNDWYANYCTAIGKTNGNAEDEEMIRMASSEYFTSKFIRK
jgi:hypothetical protein